MSLKRSVKNLLRPILKPMLLKYREKDMKIKNKYFLMK